VSYPVMLALVDKARLALGSCPVTYQAGLTIRLLLLVILCGHELLQNV
jgi:hypothetical protein